MARQKFVSYLHVCTAKTKKVSIFPIDTTAPMIKDLSSSSLHKHQTASSSSDDEIVSNSSKDDIEGKMNLRYAVGSIALLNQRLNYRREVLDESNVFCQGSSGFKSSPPSL